MGLKSQLQNDLTAAMRARDVERRAVLRMLLAAVKEEEIEKGRELDEGELQGILIAQAKRRRETIADAERAGRPEMAASERAEIAIIQDYLPEQLSRDEVRALAEEVIAETGASDMKEMGQVMGRLMPRVKGRAEGRVVSDVVRELLQQK
jgi:uncharacterized protein YqeY